MFPTERSLPALPALAAIVILLGLLLLALRLVSGPVVDLTL